jgi:hydroxyacylglutathione hydrolase
MNVALNKMGYENIDTVMERGLQAMNAEEFEAAANETDAVMLDTRNDAVVWKGFIPNSINISLDGQFAPWVGALDTGCKTATADNCRTGKGRRIHHETCQSRIR